MNPKITKSEEIANHIESMYQKDKEFYKQKINRHRDRQAILELLGLDDSKGKNLYSQKYKQFLKRNKIFNSDFQDIRFRRTISNSEFKNVKITAKPSGITDETKSPIDEIKDEIRHEHPHLASKDEQDIDSDVEHFEQASHLIPVESVSIFWDGVWQLMKLKWSMIAPLSPQERESLGMMWHPFFEQYTSEKFIILGIPIIMTFGIFAGKIREGMRLKKERKQREEKQEDPE